MGAGRPALIAAAVAILALAGCREDEQDRTLRYDKGIYSGTPMPEITDDTRDTLRDRAQAQAF